MTYMLVRNKVRDFKVWKEVFDSGADAATGERAGVLDGEIRYVEDVARRIGEPTSELR